MRKFLIKIILNIYTCIFTCEQNINIYQSYQIKKWGIINDWSRICKNGRQRMEE